MIQTVIQDAKLADFCRQTGLKRDKFREQMFATETEDAIKAWSKSASSKAVWANRKALTKQTENDIIIANSSLLRIPQFAASSITQKVNSGEYSLILSKQHFAKHTEGTAQYEQYKKSRIQKGGNPQSILTIDYDETQAVIRQSSGTGIVDVTRDGKPRNVEYVSYNKPIGYYYGNGEYHETNKCAIHYGKRSTHIVPVKGDFYD